MSESKKVDPNMLLKAANRFENLIAQLPQASSQPGDLQAALDKAGVWGGNPFNVNGPVADLLFGIFEKTGYVGKINATLAIDPSLNVKISVAGKGPKAAQVAQAIQAAFAPRMTAALKKLRVPPPAQPINMSWLEGVGNA